MSPLAGGSRGSLPPGGVRRGPARRGLAPLLAAVLALAAASCARVPGATRPPPALRLSEVAGVGDPARRASMRLVLQGLDEDAAWRPGAAQGSYERALQVDPNNPWAWLALARHEVEHGDPRRALGELDKAESLLPDAVVASVGVPTHGVQAHLIGLRGAALRAAGQGARGQALLEEARRRAPVVWADGSLDAAELR